MMILEWYEKGFHLLGAQRINHLTQDMIVYNRFSAKFLFFR